MKKIYLIIPLFLVLSLASLPLSKTHIQEDMSQASSYASRIEKYQQEAINSLNEVDLNDYRSEQVEEINSLKQATIAKINQCQNYDEIDSIVSSYNRFLLTIKTDAQLTEEEAEEIPQAETYYISTLNDLFDFRDDVNAGYNYAGETVVLTNDIVIPNGTVFGDSIGNVDTKPFSGTFDGGGHTISGFTKSGPDSVALFSRVTNGTIKNLKMENVNVTVTSSQRAAGVVSRAMGATLDNVHVTSGTISGPKQNGGLVGVCVNELSTITNCSNHASVTGTSNTVTDYGNGGLVGFIHSGGVTISNSINYGTVEAGATGAGGIIGTQIAGNVNISNSDNRGNIHGTKEGVGGILGYIKVSAASSVAISGCTNYAQVKGDSGNGFGGIFGANYDATSYLMLTINDCVNKGNIFGVAHVGGIAGLPRIMKTGSIIQDCENYGDISASSANGYCGGVVSRARIIVQNCACYSEAKLTNNGTTILAKNANADGKGSASNPGFILTVIDSSGSLVGGKLINADGSDLN